MTGRTFFVFYISHCLIRFLSWLMIGNQNMYACFSLFFLVTDINGAVLHAIDMLTTERNNTLPDNIPSMIILLTDGDPTAGMSDLQNQCKLINFFLVLKNDTLYFCSDLKLHLI